MTEPRAGTGFCLLCHRNVPTYDLLGHLRVMHPDKFGDGVVTWPDGGPLIEEDLTVEDFTQEQR